MFSGLDVLHAGIATHFVKSNMLNDLETALITMDSEKINKDSVGLLLSEFQFKAIGNKLPDFVLKPQVEKINEIFGGETVEEILKSLEKNSQNSDWAKEQKNLMGQMSPTSLKISHKGLLNGAKMDLKNCLQME